MSGLATREKTRLWLLILIGVVATLLGQTHAQEIFAPSPHESGIFAPATQAATGEIYDACQYDAPDSLNAAKELELGAANTWGRAETLTDHFVRHGGDFGSTSAEAYANEASSFLQRSQLERLPTKIGSDGTIRIYEPSSNTFGSFGADGTTKTLFKPNSPTYFDRQPGVLHP